MGYSIRSLLLATIVLCNCVTWTSSRHHFKHHISGHRTRHRRNGAKLYLPGSYIIPGGEGSGPWGEWEDPTPCSRTCGGGVSSQKRICLDLGEHSCQGGDKKYFSCNTQDCPEGTPEFREQQCTEKNSIDIRGVYYDWIPYRNGNNPCKLECMPKHGRFFFTFDDVVDGTRCDLESSDVCVAGICQPVGCDMMLGSDAREDKCRQCRGNGTKCFTIKSTINTDGLIEGYNDVLLIPSGATNIRIAETAPSNSYLALRSKENSRYYINGYYRIDFPRTFQIAGTLWEYERKRQGFPAPDKFKCLGPTTEPLYLSILVLQNDAVDVEYEYSVPTSLDPPLNVQYNWVHEAFTPCSVSCGGGYQTREVTCKIRDTLEEAEEHLCNAQLKMATNQSCNTKACPPQWVSGEWSSCDKPCGSGGLQSRTVRCEVVSDGSSHVVDDDKCIKRLGEKPDLYRKCNVNDTCPTWFVSPWLPCDHLCDKGKQTRQVVCHQHVDGKVEVYPDSQCADDKPAVEQECMLRPCDGVDWVTTKWVGCDSCVSEIRTRIAKCATKDQKVVNATFCEYHKIPVLEEKCDKSLLPSCDVQWYATQWSNCSVQCGQGIQSRLVFCGRFNGISVEKVDDSRCKSLEKYNDTKTCEIPEDKCPAEWFAGPWSDCTRKCGGGEQYRRVMCLSAGNLVGEARCNPETILDPMITCNTGPCDIDETLPVDVTATTILDEEEEEVECEEDYPEEGAEEDDTTFSSSFDDMMFSDSPSVSTYEGSGLGLTTELETTFTSETGSGAETETTLSFATDMGSGVTDITESTTDISETTESSIDISGSTETTDVSGSTETTDVSGTTQTDSSGSTETTDVSGTTATDSSGSTETTDVSGTTETDSSGKTETTEDSTSLSSSTEFDGSTTDGTTDVSTTESGTTSSDSTTDLTTDSSTTDLTTDSSTTDIASTTNDVTTEGSSTESGSSTVSGSSSDGSTTEINGSTTESPSSSTMGAREGSTTESSTDITGSTVTEETESSSETGSTETGFTETTQESTTVAGSTEETGSTETTEESSTVSGITEETGSTETTEETSTVSGSTEETVSTDATSSTETESTEATDSTLEASSTTEFYSSESSTIEDSTPWDWSTTIEVFTTKKRKMCKAKKARKCIVSKFGCCPDKKTAAAGPFDEGCPNPKTCKETKYGCCPDKATPASGPKDKGCPIMDCELSLYGCCKSDNKTSAEGNDDKGCPPPPPACSKSKFGCCQDNKTEASGPKKKGCPETASPKPETRLGEGRDCSSSKFGCCYDNETEAKGPNRQGCPCESTEFGCCPDGVNAATGVQLEGCILSCNTSAFGCCTDNVTPAHGPDNEGCCLLYRFGCCPDNYYPAEGPHLEGCGCNNSRYGCCEDNVTIMQGPNNKGCGCQYTEFGCCPDRHTEATGPKFEGCECHTHQYGCCPDGKTIAKGPNLRGCLCEESEFGCCGDKVTAAQGPNGTGCDCGSSQHGCCPDGVTDAQGPKFFGCTDAPESRQEACSLPTERGSCRDFVQRWFYDMEYGGCSRFWYGGCDGNGNNFESKDECDDICVKPPPKDACKLPKVKGVCQEYNLRWHFDQQREQCVQFVYGGCLGNANNFETKEACQEQCEPERSQDLCKSTLERGSCAGNFRRWGFNDNSGRCEEFIWGGCEGNSNRFSSETACMHRCNAPGTLKEQCLLPQEAGNCTQKLAKWSFSQAENRCVPFYYTGCNGNDNMFDFKEHCESSCPSAYVKEACVLPPETGECDNYREKWFYDTEIARCRQFYYGGCGGNGNNFVSEEECSRRCAEQAVTTTTVRPQINQGQENCNLPIERGPCNDTTERWAYDTRSGRCVKFLYGGCGGNRNNYLSEAYCQYYCNNVVDTCLLPMSSGPCQESQMQWFYDHNSDSCSQFTYGGCEGNDNRFDTRELCERRCRIGPTESTAAVTQPAHREEISPECQVPADPVERCQSEGIVWYYSPDHGMCISYENPRGSVIGCRHTNVFASEEKCERSCGNFRNMGDICSYGKEVGPCSYHVQKYYYDSANGSCVPFMFGGCHGGPNRFSTLEECQEECVTVPEDPCSQQPDVGPCRGSIPMWYYNAASDECGQFRYGGCKGNENRFQSRELCERRCKRVPNVPTTVATPHVEHEDLDVYCKPNPGNEPCGRNISLYYYDAYTGECTTGPIGDCPYYNRHFSEEECLRKCGKYKNLDACRYPLDPGPCLRGEPKFYFERDSGSCLEFTYGGCEGNPNRFSTIEECQNTCSDYAPGPQCREAVSLGEPCDVVSSRRWYYSTQYGECVAFAFAGCGGNRNNFASLADCVQTCNPGANEVIPNCDRVNEECQRLQCEHGIERVRNADNCDACVCRTPPNYCEAYQRECETLQCEHGIERQATREGCERCVCAQDECEVYKQECEMLKCQYGLSRFSDGRCLRCSCMENPCTSIRCEDGERCVFSAYQDPQSKERVTAGDCKTMYKSGVCPPEDRLRRGPWHDCQDECSDDADCSGASKCCSNGCARRCTTPAPNPVTYPPTTTYRPGPEVPQAPQANTETEPEVHSEEGGKATLRCLFHGNPPPRITWTRRHITIDGTVGRYRILSDGALEIVSLYRNDSGVYICIATNDLGQARQEINLQVNDPTPGEVGISGEDGDRIIGDLNQKLLIRCLAYGFPEPEVTWHKNETMIPFSSQVYEARGNTLLIRSLSVRELGEYVCQAYNGIGRAASWTVKVHAYANGDEDSPYLIRRYEETQVTPPRTLYIPTVPTPEPEPEVPVYTVPVSTHVYTERYIFAVGSSLMLPCEADGYPAPVVFWTKDNQRLFANNRTHISDSYRLTISDLREEDSGTYACYAKNDYSSHTSSVTITVEASVIPATCTDNPQFATCGLIVKSKFCRHPYYSTFCCRSCVEAGQLRIEDLPQNMIQYKKK